LFRKKKWGATINIHKFVFYQIMRQIQCIILLLFCQSSFSQEYSKAKVYTGSEGLVRLAELGIAADHGSFKENAFVISDFSSREINLMRANGFELEILIDDVQAFYVEQNLTSTDSRASECSTFFSDIAEPSNFNLGTMGGYLKYQEMLDELDEMANLYPNLITIKQAISTYLTFEGRPIYYVVLSDNPTVTEAEPNVLYTAIHHAREPLGMSQTIFYMWYLLENYNSNDEVKFLVDNNQLFFVPCINPDGYIYNEVTNPNGGGMHRKNRRDTGANNLGVDLNRNYSFEWGTAGISFDMESDVYPGDAAFSEPETQAIKYLVENYGFTTALNAHTYGDLLLHPIGTDANVFADHHDYLSDLSQHMVEESGYTAQKASALYPVSGGSDDYMYRENIGTGLKDTVFAMTPEIGSSFWPPSSQIVTICKQMIHTNKVMAHIPHKYLDVNDLDPTVLVSNSGNLTHSAFRLGLEDGAITVSIEPLLNIETIGAPVTHDLALREEAISTISYSLVSTIAPGDEVRFVLITDYGVWEDRDTIIKVFGNAPIAFNEDASTTTNWSGSWGTTESDFVTATSSFTDSPLGNYQNGANTTFTFDQVLDLTTTSAAWVSFFAQWDIEASYDYCQFQVSTDLGSSWIPQCGNWTQPGINGFQPVGEPLYDGLQADWVLENIDLNEYLGQEIMLRFQLRSDGSTRKDGFYFDDFIVYFENPAAIEETDLSFSMSPNPATSQVTVFLENFSSKGHINVMDQSGRIFKTISLEGSTDKIVLDSSTWASGLYTLIVSTEDTSSKPKKLVVLNH
jgi:carboxypeptidase T